MKHPNILRGIHFVEEAIERALRGAVVSAARELGAHTSEPSFDDSRISYVEIQIDRDALRDFRGALAALDALEKEGK
jgi:hypothetical protein